MSDEDWEWAERGISPNDKNKIEFKKDPVRYIVVQVDQDYDHVDAVDYISGFPTLEEAQSYIKDRLDEQNAAWTARFDYINKWVSELECPETDFEGWKKFLEQFHPFGVRYVLPQDFKMNLEGYLKSHHSAIISGYNPPHADFRWSNLFIVNINFKYNIGQKIMTKQVGEIEVVNSWKGKEINFYDVKILKDGSICTFDESEI